MKRKIKDKESQEAGEDKGSRFREGVQHKQKGKSELENKDGMHEKLSILLMENLSNLHQIEDYNFRRMISKLSGAEISQIPNMSQIFYQVNQVYHNYQQYFSQFFTDDPERSYSLTLYKWHGMNHTSTQRHYDNEGYIFFNVQYVNDTFNISEFPLGLFKLTNDKGETDLGLIRNTILKDLRGKVNFITTNFELDYKSRNIIKFLLNDELNLPNLSLETKCNDKILTCFPTFLFNSFRKLVGIMFAEHPEKEAIAQEYCLEDGDFEKYISILFKEYIHQFLELDLSYLKVDPDLDPKGCFMKELANSNNNVLKLRSLALFKPFLTETHRKLLSESQWQKLEFISPISATIYKLLTGGSLTLGNSCDLLKLIKYEIFFLERFYQHSLPKMTLLPDELIKGFEEFSINLEKYHKSVSSKISVLLATYLSPSTKKFLKESEIQTIRSLLQDDKFEKGSGITTTTNVSNSNANNHNDDSVEELEGIIMDIFLCSGNLNQELLVYESMIATEPQASSLQEFWASHKKQFPRLSRVARKILSIQINTCRGFDTFQANFGQLLKEVTDLNNLCSIEAIYFVHKLSTQVDLLLMDPRDQMMNVEEYEVATHSALPPSLTTRDINFTI